MARSARRRGNAVTIQAVAEHAGVSAMTVSNVINETGKVGDATRARVRASVEVLGYTPNMAARGLASAETIRIGLIYDEPQSPFVSAMLIGALNVTSTRGVQLLIRRLSDHRPEAAEALAQALVQSGASAVLLMPPFAEMLSGRAAVAALGVPLAAIAPGTSLPGFLTVRIDEQAAAFAATELLIGQGHRRIGLIAGPAGRGGSGSRREGYAAALRAHGIAVAAELQVTGTYQFDGGVVGARQLLDLADPPTAIFASNDDMAAGVVSFARSRNIRVPQSLAVFGFDDMPIAQQVFPALSTIRQPITEMAERATEKLIAAIRDPDDVPRDTIMDFALIERASTGKSPD